MGDGCEEGFERREMSTIQPTRLIQMYKRQLHVYDIVYNDGRYDTMIEDTTTKLHACIGKAVG